MNEETIARIEKDLITKRFERLEKMPASLRLQLKRIEDNVFELWDLDNVFTGQVRLDALQVCANSKLTLDQLEDIVKNEGERYSKRYNSYLKAFNKIAKIANRVNKKLGFNIISKLNGKDTRTEAKV